MDPASQMNVLKSNEAIHQWYPNQKSPATEWEARIDALMDAQNHSSNFAERKKYFDEVQGILAEQLPMIFTATAFTYVAARGDIGNLHPSILAPYHLTWNVQEWYFKN